MTNWKTTIAGIAAGAGIVVLNLIQSGTTDFKTLAMAFGIAALGLLSKDKDVTGGSRQQ